MLTVSPYFQNSSKVDLCVQLGKHLAKDLSKIGQSDQTESLHKNTLCLQGNHLSMGWAVVGLWLS